MTRRIGWNPAAFVDKAKECPERFELFARRDVLVLPRGTESAHPIYIEVRDGQKSVQCSKLLQLTEEQAVFVQCGLAQVSSLSVREKLFAGFLNRQRLARGDGNDFSVLITFPGIRAPLYPINEYPVISEFHRMLEAFDAEAPARYWKGEHFFAYVMDRENETELGFRARENASPSLLLAKSGKLCGNYSVRRGRSLTCGIRGED